jgi:hypothetical protein
MTTSGPGKGRPREPQQASDEKTRRFQRVSQWAHVALNCPAKPRFRRSGVARGSARHVHV